MVTRKPDCKDYKDKEGNKLMGSGGFPDILNPIGMLVSDCCGRLYNLEALDPLAAQVDRCTLVNFLEAFKAQQ